MLNIMSVNARDRCVVCLGAEHAQSALEGADCALCSRRVKGIIAVRPEIERHVVVISLISRCSHLCYANCEPIQWHSEGEGSFLPVCMRIYDFV